MRLDYLFGRGVLGLAALSPCGYGCDDSTEAVTEQDSKGAQIADASAVDSGGLADASAGPDGSAALDARATQPTGDAATTVRTEAEWLLYMREEEKLARDIYRVLAGGVLPFQNISASEQQHMDAVLVVLQRYGLPDLVADKAEGTFVNPELQALYMRLLREGSASPAAAYAVGAEIEELDLHDLAAASATVTHPDVAMLFDNLAKGSRNHLRAFDARLRALGVAYTPKYLDPSLYTQIVTTAHEAGPLP